MRSSFSMSLLYHVNMYLEFLILACTIYILASIKQVLGVETFFCKTYYLLHCISVTAACRPSLIHAPAADAHACKYHDKGKHEGKDFLFREIFVCFSHSFSYFLSLYFASGLCGTTALRSPTMIYVNTLMLCSGLILCPRGRRHLLAPPGKDEKNFMYQKTMIVITIAFVPCISWLRSGIERYADRKLSLCCQFFVSGFVGLLTNLFRLRI